MDSLPSSFQIHSKNIHSNTTLLKVSSVQIEDKPQSTTTRRRPPPPQLKKPTTYTAPPQQTRKAAEPPSLPATIFNAFDNFINTFIDPPIKSGVDPRYVLSDNFAPVDELPPTECEVVEGALPPSLDGAYIRNGPNPQFLPRGPYHLFDGDGMLHAITISDGKATLCSRFVKTYKYKIERAKGFPFLPSVFSGFNGLSAAAARGALTAARFLAGQFDPTKGLGLANTSLALIGGRLYALGESDLPYAVRVDRNGEIHTLGRHDFDGNLCLSMTAHPKTDLETGETFAFRYAPVPPFLTYFRFNSNGEKQPDAPIFSMTSPAFLHDFAITKRYAVFNEIQIGMNPMEMVSGGSPVGMNPSKVPRVGVLPRYAVDESEMRWLEVPGFNSIHAINAWDEDGGDTVVVVAPNLLSMERLDLVHASIEKVVIDLKNGIVSHHPLSARNLDFAAINPAYMGRKHNPTNHSIPYPIRSVAYPPSAQPLAAYAPTAASLLRSDATLLAGRHCQ